MDGDDFSEALTELFGSKLPKKIDTDVENRFDQYTGACDIKEFQKVDDINDVWKELFCTQKKVATESDYHAQLPLASDTVLLSAVAAAIINPDVEAKCSSKNDDDIDAAQNANDDDAQNYPSRESLSGAHTICHGNAEATDHKIGNTYDELWCGVDVNVASDAFLNALDFDSYAVDQNNNVSKTPNLEKEVGFEDDKTLSANTLKLDVEQDVQGLSSTDVVHDSSRQQPTSTSMCPLVAYSDLWDDDDVFDDVMLPSTTESNKADTGQCSSNTNKLAPSHDVSHDHAADDIADVSRASSDTASDATIVVASVVDSTASSVARVLQDSVTEPEIVKTIDSTFDDCTSTESVAVAADSLYIDNALGSDAYINRSSDTGDEPVYIISDDEKQPIETVPVLSLSPPDATRDFWKAISSDSESVTGPDESATVMYCSNKTLASRLLSQQDAVRSVDGVALVFRKHPSRAPYHKSGSSSAILSRGRIDLRLLDSSVFVSKSK